MSLKNITNRETKDGRLHLTFQTPGTEYVYSYNKAQQKSLKRGADPSDLKGRFESKKKV